VFPSPAEGFPKVVLDAMAVGRPVLSTAAGALAELVDLDLLEPIDGPTPAAIGEAWARLCGTGADVVSARVARATTFVRAHTRTAEAERLVARWRSWWPGLPWDR
jgi:glycosyltransferase involved in cell wall biosynthesis